MGGVRRLAGVAALMNDPDAWRPSRQLTDLLQGKLRWEYAQPSVQSMARLPIFHAARMICDEKSRQKRVAMLEKIPETIRPHVQAEVERLWKLKNNAQ